VSREREWKKYAAIISGGILSMVGFVNFFTPSSFGAVPAVVAGEVARFDYA